MKRRCQHPGWGLLTKHENGSAPKGSFSDVGFPRRGRASGAPLDPGYVLALIIDHVGRCADHHFAARDNRTPTVFAPGASMWWGLTKFVG
jgi:hypothetical protein